MRHAAMLPLALAFLLLAVPSGIARADDAPPLPLPAHGHALELGIEAATPTSFDGATISWRQQRGEHTAWRFGLTLDGAFQKVHSTPRPEDGGLPYVANSNLNGARLDLAVTRLTFPAPRAAVRPYFGAGLLASWYEYLREDTRTDTQSDGALVSQQYGSYHEWGPTCAAFALFGLEYPFAQRFALHAEYGEQVGYQSHRLASYARTVVASPEMVQESHVDQTQHTWSFGPRSVHTGISVFW